MLSRHDDLVGKAFAARQSLHACQVIAGKDGGRAERQCRGGACGDEPRFGPGRLRDDPRRDALQQIERHRFGRCGAEGVQHLVGHRRATQSRHGARGVDDRLQT